MDDTQNIFPNLPQRLIGLGRAGIPEQAKMELLFNKNLGPQWLADHDNPLIWELVDSIPGEELWQTHYWLKMKTPSGSGNAPRFSARRMVKEYIQKFYVDALIMKITLKVVEMENRL